MYNIIFPTNLYKTRNIIENYDDQLYDKTKLLLYKYICFPVNAFPGRNTRFHYKFKSIILRVIMAITMTILSSIVTLRHFIVWRIHFVYKVKL